MVPSSCTAHIQERITGYILRLASHIQWAFDGHAWILLWLQRCKEAKRHLKGQGQVSAGHKGRPQGRCPLLPLPLYSLRVKDNARRSMGLYRWSAHHRRRCGVTRRGWSRKSGTVRTRLVAGVAGTIFGHFWVGLGWAGLGCAGLGSWGLGELLGIERAAEGSCSLYE